MLRQILDAVIVVDFAVLIDGIGSAKAVLHNEQRDLIAVIELIAGDPKPERVDLPAPFAGFQIRIPERIENVSRDAVLRQFRVCRRAVGGVIAESHKIHASGLQYLRVARFLPDLNVVLAEEAFHISRIVSSDLNVAAKQALPVLVQRLEKVGGRRCERVCHMTGDHTADLVVGVDLVAYLHRQRACDQLMMQGLIDGLYMLLIRLHTKPRADKGEFQGDVDLVEGHPKLDLALVAFKHSPRITDKKLDQPAVSPPAISFRQVRGNLKMVERDHGLYAVGEQFVKQRVVESQALLVRLGLISLGKNARPRNGGAKKLEAHFRKQADILFVAVKEIDCRVVGRFLLHAQRNIRAFRALAPSRQQIVTAQALASLLIRALRLAGGYCAAQHKVLGKPLHMISLLSGILSVSRIRFDKIVILIVVHYDNFINSNFGNCDNFIMADRLK